MRIVISSDIDEVRNLRDVGFCPVECAFGEVSVVDDLEMDHHGSLHDREPVSLRAWRDHHAAREEDPRFVVAGELDADAAFAIAALAGIVPGPGQPGGDRAGEIAGLIAQLDADPIGVDVTMQPAFGYRRIWADLYRLGGQEDALVAVLGWGVLCRVPEHRAAPYLAAAVDTEQRRLATAAEEEVRCLVPTGDERVLALDGVSLWGFDRWYGRDPSRAPGDVAAWRHPVVLTLGASETITIGCPNVAVAEALFGPGGLQAVFPRLEPAGWGGRPTIGGSPRGLVVERPQLQAAAGQVVRLIDETRSVSDR